MYYTCDNKSKIIKYHVCVYEFSPDTDTIFVKQYIQYMRGKQGLHLLKKMVNNILIFFFKQGPDLKNPLYKWE